MTDVIVVGGGPAGSIAALVLARAGVEVTVLDRATFPREKLCGDSVNPGAMALLARLGVESGVIARGVAVSGMLLTGPRGAVVEGRYPPGVYGRSIRRSEFDALLLDAASRAGARIEQGTRVTSPIVDGVNGSTRVIGVRSQRQHAVVPRSARIVIAADGRRSTLAFALGLASQPVHPRRWAIGAYFEGVAGLTTLGEMHVRRSHYLGVAPMPDGLTNACLVIPDARARAIGTGTAVELERALHLDEHLAHRFRTARRVTEVIVLGPLAVDTRAAGIDGLLLAGDAAGFIDPITGDGLRLAMRGGELAAESALAALGGARDAPARLAWRRRELQGKQRLNRLLRRLVDFPAGVSATAALARVVPNLLAPLASYAGDVDSSPLHH